MIEPAKRATEFARIETSVARFAGYGQGGYCFPALKRWANFNRPLRGRNAEAAKPRSTQHLFDHAVTRLQSFRQFLRWTAAAFVPLRRLSTMIH